MNSECIIVTSNLMHNISLFTAPVSARTSFSPSYVETVRSKLKSLEKRVRIISKNV